MLVRCARLALFASAVSALLAIGCGDTAGDTPSGSGGARPGTAGSATSAGENSGGVAGSPGSAGSAAVNGGSSSGVGGSPAGGSASGEGGGGRNTAGGAPGAGGPSAAGSGGGATVPPLDCGDLGWVVENHGPPDNRVNYAIMGDGYLQADLAPGGAFEQHIKKAMTKRFSSPIGEVYGRYRKFVNICAIKLPSTGAICGASALECCGTDESRLAQCNEKTVQAMFKQHLPSTFMKDWNAVVLNGKSWWNTGAALMLWSGGHDDAAGAALHEGGHGFHQLDDEYCDAGAGTICSTMNGGPDSGDGNRWLNMTNNGTTTGDRWPKWLGYMQTGATGVQGTFSTGSAPYRPSANSMMNSLFGNNVNTSFNAVSREKMIMDIWRFVVPIDSTEPPAGAVSSAGTLVVNVIDPVVINVDWTVDGVTKTNGGTHLDLAGLASGSHTISAKAYDNAGEDLVRHVPGTTWGRQNWTRSVQTVTWTVTVP